MKRRGWIAIGVAGLVVLAVGGGLAARRTNATQAPRAARAPSDVRIRVQVVNTTRTRGLARKAAHYLRDLGYDVVEVGTSSTPLDTTVVLDLSGHPEWARRVAAAFEAGTRVRARPDSSRYLDISVLIGAAWRPPAEPFYP